MGIFGRKKTEKEVRYIIKEIYGDDIRLFSYNYAKNIYSIPEVRTAIEAIADIFATIPIYHKVVNKESGEASYLEDATTYVLQVRPNKLQNGVQFWKNVISQLLLENNVFIEPIYDETGNLCEIYPLPFNKFEFELNEKIATVKFFDIPNVSYKKYNLSDLVYVNRFSSLNGGKETNLGLYETVMQALSNQILKVTAPKKVKAILQGTLGSTPNIKDKDRKGTMKNLQASFDDNVEGISYVDSQWKITPVNWQENDVNRDLMSFIINVVFNYFKISDSIINHKCSEIEREMFIADSIRPIAAQLEQELTSKLFTQREIAFGHKIEFDTFALSVSTMQSKTTLFSIAARNGILNQDEMREYLGQPPLPNGLGKKYRVSADCVDLALADKYQLGKVGKDVSMNESSEDKNKQEEKVEDERTKSV